MSTSAIHESENKSFKSRLEWLLDGRRPYPWVYSLGSDRGVAYRVFKQGQLPGPEVLENVARIENVSLSWLLAGRLPPFQVSIADSDADLQDKLRAHDLTDTGTVFHLVTGAIAGAVTGRVIVAARPAMIETPAREVRYTEIEIIRGGAGPVCVQWLTEMAKANRVFRHRLDCDTCAAIARGYVGTWKLLGDEETPGILSGAAPAGPGDLEILQLAAELRDQAGDYKPRGPDEDELVETMHNVRRLTPASRRVTRSLVEALLTEEAKKWEGL